jgi:nucleotide-binding universal stress UspA family protein
MLTHILVPLDGSLLARAALDVAIHIADFTCEITLVTVIQEPEIPSYPTTPVTMSPEYYPTLPMLERDSKRYLEEIAESLRLNGYQVSTRVEVGEAADGITQAANALHVDMIVMSTHGRTGMKRWLFGSVANRVLKTAQRPVLLVPNHVVQDEYERQVEELNFG